MHTHEQNNPERRQERQEGYTSSERDERAEPRSDGRIRKGEVRNRWGRRGKPKHEDEPDDFNGYGVRMLRKRVKVTDDGKQVEVPLYEAILMKSIRDLVNAPIKARMEILFHPRSRMREIFEQAAARDNDRVLWNEDLEQTFQDMNERYFFDDEFYKNQQRAYAAYEEWRHQYCREIGWEAFDALTTEQLRASYFASLPPQHWLDQCPPDEQGR